MATTVAVLEAKLLANTRDFDQGMDKSEGKMTSMAKTAGKAGLAGAIIGLGVAAKLGFQEFSDAAKVTAQTNAVLQSTGGIANVTAGSVDKLANSLLKKSGVDDEEIKRGENMLLTFTNIRNELGKGNDIFDQATKATLDLSVATGKDMTSSSVLLGKALNDPVKGLTALTRVGVAFSAEQKTMIKDLVEGANVMDGLNQTTYPTSGKQLEILTKATKDHVPAVEALKMAHINLSDSQKKVFDHMTEGGHVMEAQKIILKELNTEFGGSAEALGKTLPGQINIAKETMLNFVGDLVAKVIPAIENMIGWLRDHWPEIRQAIQSAIAAITPIVKNLGDLFVTVVGVIKDNWGTIGPILQQVAHVLQDTAKIIAAAIKLVTDLLKGDWSAAWQDAKKIVVTMLDSITTQLTIAVTIFLGLGTKLGGAIKDGVIAGLTGTAAAAWGLLNLIGSLITGAMDTIKGWGSSLGGWVKNAVIAGVTGTGAAVWNLLTNIGALITGAIATIKGWGTSLGTWVKDAVVAGVTGTGAAVWNLLNNIGSLIIGAAETIKGWGTSLGHWVKEAVIEGITGTGAAAWNLINNIGELISGAAGTIKGWGTSVGNWVKDGVVNGVTGTATAVWNLINNIGDLASSFEHTIKGWGSKIGGWIVDALVGMFDGLGGKIKNKIGDEISSVGGSIKGFVGGVFGRGDASDPTFVPPAATFSGGTSVNLMGANEVMAPFAEAAAMFGLPVTSGLRPGAITAHGTLSDHAIGKAIDVSNGYDTPQEAAFFRSLIGNPRVKQAFFDPLGSIFGGMLSSYREGGHSDHVHVATYDRGGILPPGWTAAFNGTGRNEYVSTGAGGGNLTVNVGGSVIMEHQLQDVIVDAIRKARNLGRPV